MSECAASLPNFLQIPSPGGQEGILLRNNLPAFRLHLAHSLVVIILTRAGPDKMRTKMNKPAMNVRAGKGVAVDFVVPCETTGFEDRRQPLRAVVTTVVSGVSFSLTARAVEAFAGFCFCVFFVGTCHTQECAKRSVIEVLVLSGQGRYSNIRQISP